MRQKYYHRKLIRDKIPELIVASGDEYETRIMKDTEFEKELKKKLVEEANEVCEAPKEDLLNELSDVLQLVKSIASHYKITFKEITKYQAQKKTKRGAFIKKLFLIWSTGKGGK